MLIYIDMKLFIFLFIKMYLKILQNFQNIPFLDIYKQKLSKLNIINYLGIYVLVNKKLEILSSKFKN